VGLKNEMIEKFRFLVNKKIPLPAAMETLTEDVLIQGGVVI
jgi:hypothetical protein